MWPAASPLHQPIGEPTRANHLIDDALEDDKNGHSNSMEAEEDVIAVHWVHSIGIPMQELLLCKRRDIIGTGLVSQEDGLVTQGKTVLRKRQGRRLAYLDGANPEEPNIEHTVGNKASEVQSNEVKTETYNTGKKHKSNQS